MLNHLGKSFKFHLRYCVRFFLVKVGFCFKVKRSSLHQTHSRVDAKKELNISFSSN